MILALSFHDDLHAVGVQQAVRARGESFHILECDGVSGRPGLTWHLSGTPDGSGIPAALPTSEGRTVPPAQAKLLWWRRARAPQQLTMAAAESEGAAISAQQISLVNNDCNGALRGILAASFHGEWISPPEATDRASDKIYQLWMARQAGFRVPRTLITQSRGEVVDFINEVGRVIVKPVVGAPGPSLYTRWIEDPQTLPAESFAMCPATYQEYIPGRHHIRLNCFGERMFAALIETEELDWRPDLNVPITQWPVPEDLARLVRTVLDRLGLLMGVIDIKLTPEGEPVWLEVNPQGQFLFLEPLTGEPLTEHFADYLITTAATAGGDHRS
jgi:glutathione synthase/RimK-type ligase-like ATP-grasp enzyme